MPDEDCARVQMVIASVTQQFSHSGKRVPVDEVREKEFVTFLAEHHPSAVNFQHNAHAYGGDYVLNSAQKLLPDAKLLLAGHHSAAGLNHNWGKRANTYPTIELMDCSPHQLVDQIKEMIGDKNQGAQR